MINSREEFVATFQIGQKIKLSYWGQRWIKVLYYGERRFFGIENDGEEISLSYPGEWLPYTEPKQKVKRYQYILCIEKQRPINLTEYYKDDNDVRDGYGIGNYKHVSLIRLDETMREFDE